VSPSASVSERRAWAGLLLALSVLAIVGLARMWTTMNLVSTYSWISHTREVQTNLTAIRADINGAQNAQRGYVLVGGEIYLDKYHEMIGRMHQDINVAHRLTADNGDQQNNLYALDAVVGRYIQLWNRAIGASALSLADPAFQKQVAAEADAPDQEAAEILERLELEEATLLDARQKRAQILARRTGVVALVAFLVVVIFLVMNFGWLMAELRERIRAEHSLGERAAELEQKNSQILQQASALEASNLSLRDLSSRLLRVQDEERRRVARELHDSTGQALALLSMNVAVLQQEADRRDPELGQMVGNVDQSVRQLSDDVRTISYLLHPPLLDEMGLRSAIRWFAEGFAERSKIQVDLEQLSDPGRLSLDLETAIFRVVQECLTNIHRHSGSSKASICLEKCSQGILLEVGDQGSGIPAEKLAAVASGARMGVGLRGIGERVKSFGGDMKIESNQQGTRIKVILPRIERA
jgi:signal transduction histidine kinase